MKTKQFVINTLLIALLALGVISCKKSKLSPNCWGEKYEAIIFPDPCCPEKVLYLKLVEEVPPSLDLISRNEVPKELQPAMGDSVSVWVKFRKKNCGCLLDVACEPCCKRIKCIQKR